MGFHFKINPRGGRGVRSPRQHSGGIGRPKSVVRWSERREFSTARAFQSLSKENVRLLFNLKLKRGNHPVESDWREEALPQRKRQPKSILEIVYLATLGWHRVGSQRVKRAKGQSGVVAVHAPCPTRFPSLKDARLPLSSRSVCARETE